MERSLGWTGILIDADPDSFAKLVERGRKSWTLPVCLSLKPYPTQVIELLSLYSNCSRPTRPSFIIFWAEFLYISTRDKINHLINQLLQVTFHINSVAGNIFSINDEADETENKNLKVNEGRLETVQCFPLYSLLLAVGQTRIDYFSVDVEGSEKDVLTSIPWHKVHIKVGLTVEKCLFSACK